MAAPLSTLERMLQQLSVLGLRACLRTLGLRPSGKRPEMLCRLKHAFSSQDSGKRTQVFNAVRATFLAMPRPVARPLALEFDAMADGAADQPIVPVEMLWPSLFATPPGMQFTIGVK